MNREEVIELIKEGLTIQQDIDKDFDYDSHNRAYIKIRTKLLLFDEVISETLESFSCKN